VSISGGLGVFRVVRNVYIRGYLSQYIAP